MCPRGNCIDFTKTGCSIETDNKHPVRTLAKEIHNNLNLNFAEDSKGDHITIQWKGKPINERITIVRHTNLVYWIQTYVNLAVVDPTAPTFLEVLRHITQSYLCGCEQS